MGLDHTPLALLLATATAAAFVAVGGDGAPVVEAERRPLGPDDVGAALRTEEAMLRRVVDARVRRGGTPSTGADPLFLAVGPAGEPLVVSRAGDVFAIDDQGVRPAPGLTGASPSPRLLAWLSSAGDDDDDDDDDVSALIVLPGGSADVVSLRRLARQIVVTRGGGPRITVAFEGAVTSAAARREGDRLVVYVVGVEDAPLDRSLGTFGRLDPHLFRLELDADGAVVARAALNLGPHGVVTPKAIALRPDGRVIVAGAGSGTLAVVSPDLATVEGVMDGLVGANDVVLVGGRAVLASPLADAVAVVDLDDQARRVVPVRDPARPQGSALARLGEALLFTTALAPEQTSEGAASRFTCEACHDDGGVDGRRHSSGRFGPDGEVIVTTKPLRGLFQNAPLFSRAYDESVAAMVHAEVRVANAGSPRGPWTPLVPALDAPFLEDVVGDAFGDVIDPVTQRRAMLHALADLAPRPVPSTTMTPTARDWERFAARCAGCHAPRVFADDPSSHIQDLELAARMARLSGLVWASERRVDVGVRPLVREGGARVSSLRGIAHKRPLLTNGRWATLRQLVSGLRVDVDGHIWHDGPADRGEALPDDDAEAILRVLQSL